MMKFIIPATVTGPLGSGESGPINNGILGDIHPIDAPYATLNINCNYTHSLIAIITFTVNKFVHKVV